MILIAVCNHSSDGTSDWCPKIHHVKNDLPLFHSQIFQAGDNVVYVLEDVGLHAGIDIFGDDDQ